MTPEQHRWALAYLEGQTSVTFDGDWPQCATEVMMALLNLGGYVRAITADATTPYEMALHRLTFATDQMLAMLLAPCDETTDQQVTRTWLAARAEVLALDLRAM